MPSIPIIMPQLGESIAEATVVNLLVQIGDQVQTDQQSDDECRGVLSRAGGKAPGKAERELPGGRGVGLSASKQGGCGATRPRYSQPPNGRRRVRAGPANGRAGATGSPRQGCGTNGPRSAGPGERRRRQLYVATA